MSYPILTTQITSTTLMLIRDRTRQVGEIFGLGTLENTRFITAVSEIARNAVQYAGSGTVAFVFREEAARTQQAVLAVVSDKGPGIPDVDKVLSGRARSIKGKIPMGIAGARRLADELGIVSPKSGGTVVTIEMLLPRNAARLGTDDLIKRTEELARQRPKSPLEELERQNREMMDTLQELRDKQMELKRADERKNQFLATLAHELRNPLGTLHMNLEILRRNLDLRPEDLARRREAMARQTDQMTRLIEDLMDVSRVSQGKFELNKVPLEVNELVTQALEMVSAAIVSKEHDVTVKKHSDDLWIFGDATRLKQVLGNLIQNAARYTPAGGKITVSVWSDETQAHVEVADNGIGIAADMLPQVFDMFVQAEAKAAYGASSGGLGIGLTLVRRLIEAHGGKVNATSAGVGQGSEFLIVLPLRS